MSGISIQNTHNFSKLGCPYCRYYGCAIPSCRIVKYFTMFCTERWFAVHLHVPHNLIAQSTTPLFWFLERLQFIWLSSAPRPTVSATEVFTMQLTFSCRKIAHYFPVGTLAAVRICVKHWSNKPVFLTWASLMFCGDVIHRKYWHLSIGHLHLPVPDWYGRFVQHHGLENIFSVNDVD